MFLVKTSTQSEARFTENGDRMIEIPSSMWLKFDDLGEAVDWAFKNGA